LAYIQQRWLKDSGRAEKAYEAALKIEPNVSEWRDALVDLKLLRNDFDGAVDESLAALKRDPKDSGNHYRLAIIYLQQWRLRESLDQLKQAIALDADDARFYRTRSSIRRYQGDLSAAIADQEKAVELGKDKPFELVELANLNVYAGNTNRA